MIARINSIIKKKNVIVAVSLEFHKEEVHIKLRTIFVDYYFISWMSHHLFYLL